MVNWSTRWVIYQGFVHLDAETRAAELHWSFLFLVNLAPLIKRQKRQLWGHGLILDVLHCGKKRIISFITASMFAKGQINEQFVFTMLISEKAWVWQTPQTFCQEDSLVANAVLWGLPGLLLLPGITLPVAGLSKNEPSIKQLLPCWKNKHLP